MYANMSSRYQCGEKIGKNGKLPWSLNRSYFFLQSFIYNAKLSCPVTYSVQINKIFERKVVNIF